MASQELMFVHPDGEDFHDEEAYDAMATEYDGEYTGIDDAHARFEIPYDQKEAFIAAAIEWGLARVETLRFAMPTSKSTDEQQRAKDVAAIHMEFEGTAWDFDGRLEVDDDEGFLTAYVPTDKAAEFQQAVEKLGFVLALRIVGDS